MEDKLARTIILIDPSETGAVGGDMIVAMSALKKGDRFRIETDMLGDDLHGHEKDVWVVTSAPYQTGHYGVWGVEAIPSYEADAKSYQAGDIPIEPAPITPEPLPAVAHPDSEPDPGRGERRPAELRVGDVVRLRSGGPLMTVTRRILHTTPKREPAKDSVTCVWIRDNGRPDEDVFPAACLLVDREAKKPEEASA